MKSLSINYVRILSIFTLLLFTIGASAQNPNFHIYLCFGQSNMEGQGPIEAQDKIVDSRFKVLQSLDCSGRSKNTWYTAIPPLCQCGTGLSPADYFGKTMVKYLPEEITIGVINVAVGGSDIRLFDKDLYQDYVATFNQDWYLSKIQAYNGNPRKHLMDLARLAQQDGVIKGILIHQGEANTGNNDWPLYVKKIYNEMLAELSLNASEVPLLAGEVLSETGNCCATWMNPIINKLPLTVPTAHVVSAEGLTGQDPAHFDTPGYRKLGVRYAAKMLSLMGVEAEVIEPEYYYFEPECSALGVNWDFVTDINASNNTYITIKTGHSNTSAPANDAGNEIHIDFTAKSDTVFHVFARVKCPTVATDSYWLKIDDGDFEYIDGLASSVWSWKKLKSYNLTKGLHKIIISNGENGARLDKIYVSNIDIAPTAKGGNALKICTPIPHNVPGRVEAESFSTQFGTTTSPTIDTDGVSDITSIDTNDYLEYIIDVPKEALYKMTLRYSAAVSSGKHSVFINDQPMGTVAYANTGNLQTYKTASMDLSLRAGRQNIKLQATSRGVQLNWLMFEEISTTGISYLSTDNVTIYPIPNGGLLNISSGAFQFSTIEIIDNTGKKVCSKTIEPTNNYSLNHNLPQGIYVLKLMDNVAIKNIKFIAK